jgi:hypothetical protein
MGAGRCGTLYNLLNNNNNIYMEKLASSKFLAYPLDTAYNNQALTVTENTKFLGLHLGCNLTWKSTKDFSKKKLNLFPSC